MKKKLLLALLFGLLVIPAFSDTIWVYCHPFINNAEDKYYNMTYISNRLNAKPNTYYINFDSGILFVWDKDGIAHVYHSDWEIECK